MYSVREQISKNTKCSYSLEQVKTILKLIKPILERSKVEEVRTLIHLMIEEITIDRKTRSVDTISIKFNRQLTEYLCLQEGASKQVSFFSDLKEEELEFVLRLWWRKCNQELKGVSCNMVLWKNGIEVMRLDLKMILRTILNYDMIKKVKCILMWERIL